MKKARWIIVAAAAMLMMMGCGTEFAGGATAGAAATGTLQGIMQVQQQRAAEIQTQLDAATKRLEAAAGETDKLAAETEIANLKQQLERARAVQTATQLGRAAVKTNWSDPASVNSWILSAAIAGAGYLSSRKKITLGADKDKGT